MASTIDNNKASDLLQAVKNLSAVQILALTVSFILLRWTIRGIYRVYFHPLSKFPGPKFSAFTRIPQLYAVGKGAPQKRITHLHEKYGSVVRTSPDELSFLDPHAWRDIYGYGTKGGQGTPPPKHWHKYGESINGEASLIVMQDVADHARVRRIFSPAFSDRALTQQAPLFTKYVDQLVKVVKASIKEGNNVAKLDMVKMYNYTTFDIMADLTFGEPLHMLDNAEYDPWVKVIFAAIKVGARINVVTLNYPLAARIIGPILNTLFAKLRSNHFDHSVTRVSKRLEKGRDSEGVDLWDMILSQEEKGKEGLTRAQMDVNASLFMLAGTETTATLLAGLTYLLLTNPAKMDKLVKEIRGAFANSADISMEAIAKLPYLGACFKEGLRRYPPVPVGLPHLTPSDGSTICGHFIPPGTTVAAHHLPMYSSPIMFKDPLSFVPERWTGDAKYADDERAVVQPFSVGSRDCLGKNMAYHEMRLILTKVLYSFDLELCPGNENWLDQSVYILWEKKPLMVNVTNRAS